MGWNPGLDNLNGTPGLPPMASPLTANGEDPDEAALKYFGAARTMGPAAVDPMRAATGQMQRAVAASLPAASPSSAAAGSAGGAGAAPPPVSVGPPAAQPLQQLDKNALTSGYGLAKRQEQAAEEEGQVPAEIAQDQQKLLADQSKTIDPKDYKPSFWARAARGLRGAAVGALTGGVPGLLVGALEPGDIAGGKAYGAPTDAYDAAVQTQTKQVGQDTQTLADAKDNYQLAQKAREDRQKGLNNAAEAMGRVATGATGQENADTAAARLPIEQQTADARTQQAFNTSPDGKLKSTEAEIAQRTKYADANRIPQGYLRNRYILTGDLQPAHNPSAQEMELAGAERAFRKEHGRAPETVAEWQQLTSSLHAGRSGGTGSPLAEAEARAIAAQSMARKEVWARGYTRGTDGGYINNAKPGEEELTPEQFAQKIDSYRTDANRAMASKGYQIDEQGNFGPLAAPETVAAAGNSNDGRFGTDAEGNRWQFKEGKYHRLPHK